MDNCELDLKIIISLPGIQFVLISYTHKHVLNDIIDKTCSNADNKD